MDRDALQRLTAAAAARLIAGGQITSEELVTACAARDSEVKAWAHVDPSRALDQARAADDWRRSGRGLGLLHGVPIGIKDIIDTGDMPTENGSTAFKGRRPKKDAACVAKLRAAGAVILGKTVTTELATATPSSTRNPHHLDHTPGGSSAGSAAAVADLMVPVALGTQTAGSVIRPASFCGAHGFKPSFGLIPRTGVLPYAPSLDTIGILARSIEDLALVCDVVQGCDSGDPASDGKRRAPLSPTATMAWPLPPRFALVKGPHWSNADPIMREAFAELAETLGADIVDVDIDLIIEAGLAAARVVQAYERTQSFAPFLQRLPGQISARLAADIEAGRHVTEGDYRSACDAVDSLRAALDPLFADHGTLMTAAAPGLAPKDLGTTGDPIFNALWTYLGLPAVTVPLLECDGLPLGVQLVGANFDDGRLLRTARLLTDRIAHGG
jgi:Asp-tRNA(Asn)/Glu-tRNA(Gln) amidotransferase A subunit family amidase